MIFVTRRELLLASLKLVKISNLTLTETFEECFRTFSDVSKEKERSEVKLSRCFQLFFAKPLRTQGFKRGH